MDSGVTFYTRALRRSTKEQSKEKGFHRWSISARCAILGINYFWISPIVYWVHCAREREISVFPHEERGEYLFCCVLWICGPRISSVWVWGERSASQTLRACKVLHWGPSVKVLPSSIEKVSYYTEVQFSPKHCVVRNWGAILRFNKLCPPPVRCYIEGHLSLDDLLCVSWGSGVLELRVSLSGLSLFTFAAVALIHASLANNRAMLTSVWLWIKCYQIYWSPFICKEGWIYLSIPFFNIKKTLASSDKTCRLARGPPFLPALGQWMLILCPGK